MIECECKNSPKKHKQNIKKEHTSIRINTITLIITIIIFFITNINLSKSPENKQKVFTNIISKIEIKNNIPGIKKEEYIEKENDLGNWYIEIPSINLKAPIAEGTEKDTLNTKVGHFTETDLTYGNIGLAAHNRGYEYNYFEKLKKLKLEETIIYKYNDFEKKYIVNKNEIIKNTDWSYLEKTEENTITLITCVENEPTFRRCVQAIELENNVY